VLLVALGADETSVEYGRPASKLLRMSARRAEQQAVTGYVATDVNHDRLYATWMEDNLAPAARLTTGRCASCR
jgi:hypothetical protein